MSLNWKEIDVILAELDLPGSQIQKIVQPSFDILVWHLYKNGKSSSLLFALTPGACRLHAVARDIPKPPKPLRFAEFLKSRIKDGWIEAAVQLGADRIVRFTVRKGETSFRLYLRLWSNAANFVVVDEAGLVLDAMRRLPKRDEISGRAYPLAQPVAEPIGNAKPEAGTAPLKNYAVRDLAGAGSFNEKIDAWYAEHAGALSLEALRDRVGRIYDDRTERLKTAIDQLRQKRRDYEAADGQKRSGDLILTNIHLMAKGAEWLDATDWETGGEVRIKIDPRLSPQANAEWYYEQYRKAKNGLAEVAAEIVDSEAALAALESDRSRLLAEENPFRLYKALAAARPRPRADDKKRPGLAFLRNDWLFLVGRSAAENDELLRRHVKGSDLWLHARDFPGAYVFVKARSGKTVPLDALLDAGNLALFYSKGRNSGQGDLYYTQAKYLRRAKNGPKGLVLPTQEKNLRVKLDTARLKALEESKE